MRVVAMWVARLYQIAAEVRIQQLIEVLDNKSKKKAR